MTAAQLIKELKKVDGDTPILIDGYEGGFYKKFHMHKLQMYESNSEDKYCGECEIVDLGNEGWNDMRTRKQQEDSFDCLLISRTEIDNLI